jgi:hypothetical protein
MRSWLVILVLLVACSDGGGSLAPLLNRCAQAFECGRASSCDSNLGICVQQNAIAPYDYRIQITPTFVTDGGQLAVSTTGRSTLLEAGTLVPITIPRAVFARGSARSDDGMLALEAELVFTPRDDNALGGARSVFTLMSSMGQAFEAQLEPNLTYDVLVYPRGSDSERYPPYSVELAMGTSDRNDVELKYPEPLVSYRGQIRDENSKPAPAGLRIKTRYRDRLLASSSIGIIGQDGRFEVYLPQSALDAPTEHELALDLSGVVTKGVPLPQNVQIAFDMTAMRPDAPWIMPVVPEPVRFTGTVEIEELRNEPFDKNTVNAQLTFISDFPLPPGNNDQRGQDWCQLRLPGSPHDTFRCSAYVAASVGPDLLIDAVLLPGSYKIVVAPSGAAPKVQRLATQVEAVQILSQPDGVQGPNAYQLTFVTSYQSAVEAPGGRPMPSVIVSANALGVRADLPEVALYNRSDRQTTDSKGIAQLAIDVGLYDLIAAPPDGSGYAWVLAFNRRIAPIEAVDKTSIDVPGFTLFPQIPILLRGSAVASNGEKVVKANVDAYALVPDLEGRPDRAVRIAHTTTDEEGKFALQMPPRIGSDDDQSEDGGVTDASADAQR